MFTNMLISKIQDKGGQGNFRPLIGTNNKELLKYMSDLLQLLNNDNLDYDNIKVEMEYFVKNNSLKTFLRNKLGDINYSSFINKITILYLLIEKNDDFDNDITPKIVENINEIKLYLDDVLK